MSRMTLGLQVSELEVYAYLRGTDAVGMVGMVLTGFGVYAYQQQVLVRNAG